MAISQDQAPAATTIEQTEKPSPETGAAQTPPTAEPVKEADLGLPSSAADGLIKKPFANPVDTAKATPRPELTEDQKTKYDAVLKSVTEWTTVPTTSAKDAPTEPITDDERMFLTRECLLRYLRATKWNATEATTRLLNTLTWRREYGLEKHTADYISVENETGKQVILGYDIESRPCLYLNPSKQNTERSDRQVEHLVFMLERLIDLMGPDQETLTLLVNFAQTSTGQNASLSQGKQTLNILQYHYPERLGRALVINIPFVIWGFLKLITPFIDPLTREKLKFNEGLRQHVPPSQLMKETGGDVEFEYDHAEYWPALNKLADKRRAECRQRWVDGGKMIGEYENYLRGGPSMGRAKSEAKSLPLEEKVASLSVDDAQTNEQAQTA
ncbi:hypothetical protein FQN54_006903 [Arachnomyces sp. PD_36]|nr:hypothetical protein FQN54_006903 [Arachnomyces sp. PD_36]